MQSTIRWVIGLALAVSLFSGCTTPTTNIDMNQDKGEAVLALDYRDFQSAAGDMVASLISSGAVSKPDGLPYVLVVSRIINDTMQHIDTDLLIKKNKSRTS